MYNLNLKNYRKQCSVYLIFMVVGIIITSIFGYLLIKKIIFNKSLNGVTQSTKVYMFDTSDEDGDTMYKPEYYYMVDGVEYKCGTYFSSSIKPDDVTNVYYDKKIPSKCLTEYEQKMDFFYLLYIGMGLVFLLVGLIPNIKICKRMKKIKELSNLGTLYRGVEYRLKKSNLTINGRKIPYMEVNHNGLVLKSAPLFKNNDIPETGVCDLLIDENDPRNYYIGFDI